MRLPNAKYPWSFERVADVTDAQRPLWEKEESVEARAQPAFAFRYWTNVELEGFEAGFGTSLQDGMRAVRDRIDEAAMRL